MHLHIKSSVLMCWCVMPLVTADGICEDNVLTDYQLGRNTTLLNIDAESISSLREDCQKEIQLTRAQGWNIFVTVAQFSFNQYYEYGGLNGLRRAQSYDKIYVNSGKCQSATPHTRTEIRTGYSMSGISSFLCLTFDPEVEHGNLGGHTQGGNIAIDVVIHTAVCPGSMPTPGGCMHICTSTGPLNNCQTTVTKPTGSSTTSSTERRKQTTVTHKVSTSSSATSHTTLTYPKQPVIPSTTLYTSKYTTNPRANQETPTASTPRPTYSPIAMTAATSSTVQHKVPLTFSSSTNMATKSTIKSATIGHEEATSTLNMLLTSPGEENMGTSTEKKDVLVENGRDFGLLEGLYVVSGCIVVLLILAVAACVVRKRKHRCFTPTGTFSDTTNNAIQWRDNWLVRYHSNNHHDDSFDQSESDVHYIHGRFHNYSNSDLHHIHLDKHARTDGCNCQEHEIYEDPWPLVRLDSSFVKKTKNIERFERENKTIRVPADIDITDPTFEQQSVCSDQEPITPQSTDGDGEPNLRSLNQHGSVRLSKPKYNVVRMQRSSSKSSKGHSDNQRNSSSFKIAKGNYVGHSKVQRTRNSSSMRSENSRTFEDMIKGEIENVESALDMEGTIDLESNASESSIGGKRGWRVNALYAIVSPSKHTENAPRRVSSTTDGRFVTRRKYSNNNGKATPIDNYIGEDTSQNTNNNLNNCSVADARYNGVLANPVDGHTDITREIDSVRKLDLGEQTDMTERASPGLPSNRPQLPNRSESNLVGNVQLTQPFKVKRDGTSGTVQFIK